MDTNTKEVLVAAVSAFSALGAAYIGARWHVSFKAQNPPADMRDTNSGNPPKVDEGKKP